jgi:hypothetical protein
LTFQKRCVKLISIEGGNVMSKIGDYIIGQLENGTLIDSAENGFIEQDMGH